MSINAFLISLNGIDIVLILTILEIYILRTEHGAAYTSNSQLA